MQRIGSYELLGELGRGGAGVIFRARDVGLRREVALKLLAGGRTPDPARLARFQREAEALARLRHPHIVRVHAAGQHEGQAYLVLDLVEGQSLAERLDAQGPLPVRRALEISLALAQALAHVHDNALLHRDLKPGNVLLTVDGTPKLTDFGLAKVRDAEEGLSREGALLGTPGYWPPEQAMGRLDQMGPASDLYSLGATLYAMLTGEAPIEGRSVQELLIATCDRVPDPPSRARPEVPAAVDAICARCLAKAPRDRYPSAAALAQAIEQALAGGPPAGVQRWRRIAWVAGLGLCAVVGAGLLGGRGGADAGASPAPTPSRAPAALPSDPLERCLLELAAGDPPTDLQAAEQSVLRLRPDAETLARLRGLPVGEARQRLLGLGLLLAGEDAEVQTLLGVGRSGLHRAADYCAGLRVPADLRDTALLAGGERAREALGTWLNTTLTTAEELSRSDPSASGRVVALRCQLALALALARTRAMHTGVERIVPRAFYERARRLEPDSTERDYLAVVQAWIFKDGFSLQPRLAEQLIARLPERTTETWLPLFVFLRGYLLLADQVRPAVDADLVFEAGKQALRVAEGSPEVTHRFGTQRFELESGLASEYVRRAGAELLASDGRRGAEATRRAFQLAMRALLGSDYPIERIPPLEEAGEAWLSQPMRQDTSALQPALLALLYTGEPARLEPLLLKLDDEGGVGEILAAVLRAEVALIDGDPSTARALLLGLQGRFPQIRFRDYWGALAHAQRLLGASADEALATGATFKVGLGLPWHDPDYAARLFAGELWWPGVGKHTAGE